MEKIYKNVTSTFDLVLFSWAIFLILWFINVVYKQNLLPFFLYLLKLIINTAAVFLLKLIWFGFYLPLIMNLSFSFSFYVCVSLSPPAYWKLMYLLVLFIYIRKGKKENEMDLKERQRVLERDREAEKMHRWSTSLRK